MTKTSEASVRGARVLNEVIPSRPSRAELYVMGRQLRAKLPRRSHAEWKPSKGRIEPLVLIKKSDEGRLPELVPIDMAECSSRRLPSFEVLLLTWLQIWQ
jgi:hypothetical protein